MYLFFNKYMLFYLNRLVSKLFDGPSYRIEKKIRTFLIGLTLDIQEHRVRSREECAPYNQPETNRHIHTTDMLTMCHHTSKDKETTEALSLYQHEDLNTDCPQCFNTVGCMTGRAPSL